MKITLINMTGTKNYIINYNCELWRCFKSYSFEIKVHLCLIFHQNKKKIHFQNYTNFFYRMVWCVNYYLPSLRIQKKSSKSFKHWLYFNQINYIQINKILFIYETVVTKPTKTQHHGIRIENLLNYCFLVK